MDLRDSSFKALDGIGLRGFGSLGLKDERCAFGFRRFGGICLGFVKLQSCWSFRWGMTWGVRKKATRLRGHRVVGPVRPPLTA